MRRLSFLYRLVTRAMFESCQSVKTRLRREGHYCVVEKSAEANRKTKDIVELSPKPDTVFDLVEN